MLSIECRFYCVYASLLQGGVCFTTRVATIFKKLKLFGVSMKYFCGLFGHPIYELLAYSER